MSERIGASFRVLVSATVSCGVLAIAGACALIIRGMVVDGLLIGAVTVLLLRWYWQATHRKRILLKRGFHTGRRIGTHWMYEELHDGVVVWIELPLDYAGRGEYEIRIPGERDWRATMPAWAGGRRAEIVERLPFKRSQMIFEAERPTVPTDITSLGD